MKRLLLLLTLVCANAVAGITDLKLSTAQIFDVQWNISGDKLNTSGFNYIFASINYDTQTASAARWTAAQTADAGSNGRHIGFFHSTTNPGTYGMAVFNSDGTTYKLINNTGSFRTLADGAIFYNGNGVWGTLITTKQGFSLGDSASFDITQQFPTNQQLEAYELDSTEPLAAGETAAPAADSLCCGGLAASFAADPAKITQVDQFLYRVTNDSRVYIEQIGSDNTITVTQSGTSNNYAEYISTGDYNTVDIDQSSTVQSATNYAQVGVTGSANTVDIAQHSTGGVKSAFVSVADHNNSVTVQQKDSGGHHADIAVAGSGKTVDVTQQGSGSHMVNIQLSGQPTALSVTQSGADQQHYSIQHNCATAGGCAAITVTQGQ